MAHNNSWTDESDSDDPMEPIDIMNAIRILSHRQRRNPPRPQHNIGLRGHQYILGILNGHPDNCKIMFRMEVPTFRCLCGLLRTNHLVRDSRRKVTVEEVVGMFCLLVGHAEGQRIVGDRFQHSTQTINKNARKVINALCEIGRHLILPTPRNNVHPYISSNNRNYPWFQGCIGVMDGTMIPVVVPAELREAYRNRLGRVTQNVLAIVDFDIKFIFVYTGWEGSAHDAHVFHHAASDPEARFPWPPEGQYYLVDSAYPCTTGLLPPIQENVIAGVIVTMIGVFMERTFGVIKEQFTILSNMPPYSVGRQGLIITACCALHNYIRTVTPDDWIFQTWSTMHLPVIEPAVGDGGSSSGHVDLSTEAQNNMGAIRDEIAISMWEARGGH
ncbi:uncharacterized protein LOC109010400 [Juglans regia]|uniref:Uncharacterized protein LOC109010400 n=1 Tax=Juglans regia TaxID=51240 RepID=A0A6P9DVH2_JUGRE|nr:uncharacterized protein LOC109010400 [Juglans regia]